MTEFKPGYTYRTKNGSIMRLMSQREFGSLTGKSGGNECVTLMYDKAGHARGGGWEAFDLLPGAIEDEPMDGEEVDGTGDATDRLNKLEAQVTDLFRQLHTERDNRAREIKVVLDTVESGRRGLVYRLDCIDKRWRGTKAAPKQIKGGWVNVYRAGTRQWYGHVHDSRSDANFEAATQMTRLACIQIPDFTEGDGL